MVTIHRLFLALAGVLLFACVANADSSPFNNLSASSDGADTVVLAAPLGDSFSTGANPFNLTSVTVELETGSLQALVPDAISSPDGSVTMTLLSNAAGTAPGTVLDTIGTLSDSSVTSTLADYTFTLSSPYTLAPDTTYWIELTSDNGSIIFWSYSFDTSGPGVGDQYYIDVLGVEPNWDGPYQMAVNGNSAQVPEPGMLLMLAAGIGAILLLKSRRTILN
jgi:hypothetical protein